MAKLPEKFVKAPAKKPAKGEKPAAKSRKKKATILSAEAQAELARRVVLQLSEDEHRRLEAARTELRVSGVELTLDEMIHRVIDEWLARPVQKAAPEVQPESIAVQLRRFVRSPLRTWRELGLALRRYAPGKLGI